MPSNALIEWQTTRAAALDEIAAAHAVIGGTGPGRRFATQQLNRAYAVLLSAHFQGFCRDLHTECATKLIPADQPPALEMILMGEFTRGRYLDRGNAQPSSIGSDFKRLGLDFWPRVRALSDRAGRRLALLEELNKWRNAIVHESFDAANLDRGNLYLAQVRAWRNACERLAPLFDAVMRAHLESITGIAPWP